MDSSKVRSATFRPIYRKFFWVLVVTVILLGYLGAKPPEGIYLILARIATAYYFIHFLILLPLLGRYEKTDPLPMSISDPVLDKPGAMDKFKEMAGKYEGENVGTFKNRARRYITVALGTDMDQFYVGQREFKNRFCLLDSIDMSSSLYGVNTSLCIVCQNTFNAAMQDKSGLFRFKVRHSKNMIAGIENMEKGIESFIGVAKQFKHAMQVAAEIPVKRKEVSEAFTGWIMKSNKDKVIPTQSRNRIERLTELFSTGEGNKGETLLDAFSAVTDFYSHESSGGKDKDNFRMKQNESSHFGAGNRAKQDFYNQLFDTPNDLQGKPEFNPKRFNGLKEIGRKVELETQNQIALAN